VPGRTEAQAHKLRLMSCSRPDRAARSEQKALSGQTFGTPWLFHICGFFCICRHCSQLPEACSGHRRWRLAAGETESNNAQGDRSWSSWPSMPTVAGHIFRIALSGLLAPAFSDLPRI